MQIVFLQQCLVPSLQSCESVQTILIVKIYKKHCLVGIRLKRLKQPTSNPSSLHIITASSRVFCRSSNTVFLVLRTLRRTGKYSVNLCWDPFVAAATEDFFASGTADGLGLVQQFNLGPAADRVI